MKKTSTSKRRVSKKKKTGSSSVRAAKKVKKSAKSAAASNAKKPTKKKVTKKKAATTANRKKSTTKKSATKKVTKKTAKRTLTAISKKKTKKVAKKKVVASSKKVNIAKKKPTKPQLAVRVGMNIPKKTPASSRLANNHTSTAATTEDPIQFIEQRKTPKTSLRAKELREYKKLLIQKRDELTGDVNHMSGSSAQAAGSGGAEHSSAPVHMADLGTDNWEHEFTLGLIVNEQKRIREIDDALSRIKNKTYGICLATHKTISHARLHAKPWAKYCIDHARARDEGRA